MNLSFIQPPQVAWASGALADGPLLRKSTRIQDLTDVFADENARQQLAGEHVVYDVEMLDTSSAEVNSTPALPIFILAGSAASIL